MKNDLIGLGILLAVGAVVFGFLPLTPPGKPTDAFWGKLCAMLGFDTKAARRWLGRDDRL